MTGSTTAASREEILSRVRASLGRTTTTLAPPVPSTARIPIRVAGEREAELNLLLGEITELGGHVRRLDDPSDLAAALAELIAAEQVARALLWQTPELRSLNLAETLARLGVEVLPIHASLHQIAACDLGITGVDAALSASGTLLLRSGPDRPRTASLVPRVHLAILSPGVLRADLQAVLAGCRDTSCATLITGPSRTSDIELTLTIGVHGPKVLYVWVLEAGWT
jgi:L-lactate dehydrogenase complex protein LldG